MCCFSRVVTGHSIQIAAASFVRWLSDPHDSSILKCITPIRMRVQGMPLYFYYVLLWAESSNYLSGKYYCGLNFMPLRETSFSWPRYSVLGLVDMDLCRSQWPGGLRRRSATSRLMRLWVRIPLRAWMSVCCECYVLSGRGLCDELITRPEESYRLCCVVVCDLETSWLRRPWPTGGCRAKRKKEEDMDL